MRQRYNNAIVGGVIGAAVAIFGLVIFGFVVPGRSLDTISIGIIVPAYVLLATLILANTNNSIDARVRSTLDRYEADYKEEIARNQKERQEAMEKAAETMKSEVLPLLQKMQEKNRVFTIRMVAAVGLFVLVQVLGQRDTWPLLRKMWTWLRKPVK